MTYYYAPYIDEYVGFGKLRRSATLKNALKGLRSYISETRCESGVILNTEDLPSPSNRRPKNLVGTIQVRISNRKINIKLPNGKTVQTYGEYFYYIPKGKRKGMMVMSDGSLKSVNR